jgi:PPOX class probable F420-dependent enzyme
VSLGIEDVRRFVPLDRGLAVVSVHRSDGGIASSVVNAGVLEHPVAGDPVVGFVVAGNARKAVHLRNDPRCTVVWRSGWRWLGVSGSAELAGPDDRLPGLEAAGVPALLRAVFVGAGGSHEDWDEYDRVMAEEARLAVVVRPERIFGVPG